MKMNGFTMKGTEASSVFTGTQTFVAGSIGYRNIGGEQFRIRVVPNNGAKLDFGAGWKTPGDDGQNRYSTVVTGLDALVQTVSAATRVLAAASIVEVPATAYVPAVEASPAHLAIQ